MSEIKRVSRRLAGLAAAWVGCAWIVGWEVADAGTATWIQTGDGAVAAWTNDVNWNAGSHPGTGAGESAYLTNRAGGVYTAVLDATLTNGLSALVLSNSLGQARLVVTNAVLTNATLTLGGGGWLEVGNGGVVNIGSTVNWLGTNGQVTLDAGGRCVTRGAMTIGGGVNAVNARVTGSGGAWDLQGNNLTVNGGGGAGGTLVISGGLLTNANAATFSGIGPQFMLTNGGLVQTVCPWHPWRQDMAVSTNARVQVVGGGAVPSCWLSSGTLTLNMLGTGSVWTIDGTGVRGSAMVTNLNGYNNAGFLIGSAPGANGNALLVTNGGSLYCSGGTIGGGGALGNRLMVVGGGGAVTSSVVIPTANPYLGPITVGAGGTGNVLTVDGAGVAGGACILNNSGYNSGVGSASGCGNLLLLTNGGQFSCASFSVGDGAAGNTSVVTGAGSLLATWSSKTLCVGNGGATGNVLAVDAGAAVTGGSIIIGNGTNAVANRLLITGGATVNGPWGSTIGSFGNSNAVVIAGAGSHWGLNWQSGFLSIGVAPGSGNTLMLTNSADLFTYGLTVGSGAGAVSNSVTIIDGALLKQDGAYGWPVVIGTNASYNAVSVSGANASWNAAGLGVIIGSGTATGNTLTVGGGGVITNVGTLQIGTGTAPFRNALVLAGGSVRASSLTIGGGNKIAPAIGGAGILPAVVSGTATLAVGSLVSPTNLPGISATNYIILTAGSVVNNGVILDPAVDPLQWRLSVGATNVVLTYKFPMPRGTALLFF